MKVKCALVQMNFSTDVDENVARAIELVREAGQNGARIISLPELSTTQYFCIGMNRAFMEYAEPLGGPSTAKIAQAARDANAYVVFPSTRRSRRASCTTRRPSSTAAASPSACTART